MSGPKSVFAACSLAGWNFNHNFFLCDASVCVKTHSPTSCVSVEEVTEVELELLDILSFLPSPSDFSSALSESTSPSPLSTKPRACSAYGGDTQTHTHSVLKNTYSHFTYTSSKNGKSNCFPRQLVNSAQTGNESHFRHLWLWRSCPWARHSVTRQLLQRGSKVAIVATTTRTTQQQKDRLCWAAPKCECATQWLKRDNDGDTRAVGERTGSTKARHREKIHTFKFSWSSVPLNGSAGVPHNHLEENTSVKPRECDAGVGTRPHHDLHYSITLLEQFCKLYSSLVDRNEKRLICLFIKWSVGL